MPSSKKQVLIKGLDSLKIKGKVKGNKQLFERERERERKEGKERNKEKLLGKY